MHCVGNKTLSHSQVLTKKKEEENKYTAGENLPLYPFCPLYFLFLIYRKFLCQVTQTIGRCCNKLGQAHMTLVTSGFPSVMLSP